MGGDEAHGFPITKPMEALAILLNPWVITAFVATFLASICWIEALSYMPLTNAHPFTALSFPLILFSHGGCSTSLSPSGIS